MKKLIYALTLISIFLSQNNLCEAQNTSIDSLKTELKNAKEDSTKVILRYAIGDQAMIFRITYWDSLKIDAEKNNMKKYVGECLNNIGFIHNAHGDIAKSLEYHKKSLTVRRRINDKSGIAISLMNIGYIYNRQGKTIQALEYFEKSLKINENINDKTEIANALSNIASIFDAQGENIKALEYYEKGLKIKREINHKSGIAVALNNIALIFRKQGKRNKELEYLKKSLKINEEINNKFLIAGALTNIGSTYRNQGDLTKALEYLQKGLKISEEINDKTGVTHSLNDLGMVYFQLKDYEKSLDYTNRSMQLSKEMKLPETIRNAAELLSKIYRKKGNYKLELDNYKLFINMRDSIKNEENQRASIKNQYRYEYEKQKILDDAENDKLITVEKEAKEKQKVITYAISGGLGLVVLFLIFVFNRLRITKKQKVVIEKQKNEVEYAHKKTHEQKEIIEEAHKEITDSINYAERIQRSFLATKELLDENLKDYFVFFQPKDVVSGDFYWAGKLNNGNFAVVNADSTGHGVPGAIMSILNISSIEKAVEQNLTDPSEIFNATRKTIIERLKKDGSPEGGKDGMDASIISFDFANNKFTYAAAINPIWVIRNGEVTVIKPDKMPVGKHDNDATPFSQGEYDLQKGDQVYTLTDGFQDQFGGEKGKKFMVKKLRELLLSIAHLPMQEQEQELKNIFFNWKGDEEQVDDVCVIGVRV